MSKSDKDNTFVKYHFLKFETADIYKDTISFCVYSGRAKLAFQAMLSNLIIRVKGHILKNLTINSPRTLFLEILVKLKHPYLSGTF